MSIILVKICDFAYFRVYQYLPISTSTVSKNLIVQTFKVGILYNLTSTRDYMTICSQFMIVLGPQNVYNFGWNTHFSHARALFVSLDKVDLNSVQIVFRCVSVLVYLCIRIHGCEFYWEMRCECIQTKKRYGNVLLIELLIPSRRERKNKQISKQESVTWSAVPNALEFS